MSVTNMVNKNSFLCFLVLSTSESNPNPDLKVEYQEFDIIQTITANPITFIVLLIFIPKGRSKRVLISNIKKMNNNNYRFYYHII